MVSVILVLEVGLIITLAVKEVEEAVDGADFVQIIRLNGFCLLLLIENWTIWFFEALFFIFFSKN